MDLWERNHAERLYAGEAVSYLLAQKGQLLTPTLTGPMLDWVEEHLEGLPREKHRGVYAGLLPDRLGVTRISLRMGRCLLECVGVSKAQLECMRQRGLRVYGPPVEICKELTLACLVETRDANFILAFRTETDEDQDGRWHASVGEYAGLWLFLEHRSVKEQVLRGLRWYTNLRKDEIFDVKTLGVAADRTTGGERLAVCCRIHTSFRGNEVLARVKNAEVPLPGVKYEVFTKSYAQVLLGQASFDPLGAAALLLALGISP